MAKFVVHFGGVGDGAGDLLAEQVAVATAKADEGRADGLFAQTEASGDFGMRGVGSAAGDGGEEDAEVFGVAGGRVFGLESVGHGLEQRERPGAVEGAVGRKLGGGGAGEGVVVGGLVERGEAPGAAFGGEGVVAEVGEVVVEGAEHPGAEADLAATEGGEGAEAEEAGEEALDGVVGIGFGEAAAEGVLAKRRTIAGAELVEGAGDEGIGIRSSMTRGFDHERPARGGERVAHRSTTSGRGPPVTSTKYFQVMRMRAGLPPPLKILRRPVAPEGVLKR